MQIGVIGAGYVGLTTAACLTEIGHDVYCSDNDLAKLELLERGGMPLFEPHLEEIVARNRRQGRLHFTQVPEAIERASVLFICVGTPPLESGEADLSSIERVARAVAEHAHDYRLVIEKSTVPVQTGRQLKRCLDLFRRNQQARYDVVSNPEFLREGSAVLDFFHPDRIVVGVERPEPVWKLREIYQPLLEGSFKCPVHDACGERKAVPFLVADVNSAEIIKHAANSFLAAKISFINLMADLCEAAGANIEKVAEGIGLDSRIGSAFLQPGIGFGGFCFPKDLQAFVRIGETFGCDFGLLREVEKINVHRVDRFIKKIKDNLWVLREKKIGVWGLAFKPDTDDVRYSPSLAIIRRLLKEGAEVQAYDPKAIEKAKMEIPEIRYCQDAYQAAEGAEAVLALTEWEEFRQIDLDKVRGLMVRPLIFDGRNMFSEAVVAVHDFEYVRIGGAAHPQTAVTPHPLGLAGNPQEF